MITYDRKSWWKTAFSFRGTALPRSLKRVVIFAIYAVLIQAVYELGLDEGWIRDGGVFGLDPAGHAVLGSLVGFMIVFRMNASNARYWEGRTHWGALINASRNLTRFGSQHTSDGEGLANLVTGYAICLRRNLQGKRDTEEADLYLPEVVTKVANKFGSPPTAIAAAISEWIGTHYRQKTIDSLMLCHMEELLSRLVDAQGGCEKIQKTPMPFVYVSMIKQLIIIYLLTLPIVLCQRCGWWSPLLMLIISLGLFGLEEASVETEDPFGVDDNCLDLVACTITIARDTMQMASTPVLNRLP